MKIVFSPFKNESNEYVNIIKELLKNKEIEVCSFKEGLKNLKSVEVFYVNWIENVKGKNICTVLGEYVLKYILLVYLKMRKKRIIWVMHNKVPHNSKYKDISKKFMKFLINISDNIIIHSTESLDEIYKISNKNIESQKIELLKHPNYIGIYGNDKDNFRLQYGIKNNELVFLFIGAVSKYKNIELLVESFMEADMDNSRLIIAGSPQNKSYKEELEKKISNYNTKKIITILEYIDNDKLVKLLNTSNIVTLPYDQTSSLNSGTIYLAFSYKRTVLSSDIGTIKDLGDGNYYYKYSYSNKEEHKRALKEKISLVGKEYVDNISILREMGEEAYKYIKANHDNNEIANDLEKIIKK